MIMNNGFDLLYFYVQCLKGVSIFGLFVVEFGCVQDLVLWVGLLYVNFVCQKYDVVVLQVLLVLVVDCDVGGVIICLFRGEQVNLIEGCVVLYIVLCGDVVDVLVVVEVYVIVCGICQCMGVLVCVLEDSGVIDVVSVGIGGFDFGLCLVVDVLCLVIGVCLCVYFVLNVDGVVMQCMLVVLDLVKIVGILIFKIFGIQEILFNGQILYDWLGGSECLYVVSVNLECVVKVFVIVVDCVLLMWDWVGGCYLLWLVVGFLIVLVIGFECFEQLLEGVVQMDVYVLDVLLECNLLVLYGFIDIWNCNLFGYVMYVVMIYDQCLVLLLVYLQQLVMESLGKCVQCDGQLVIVDIVLVWWGGVGIDVQYSFFQVLYQGISVVLVDFIGCVYNDDLYMINYQVLLVNLLVQIEVLVNGQGSEDLYCDYLGGWLSMLILFDVLILQVLGVLIVMYEYVVYVQLVIWNINVFDQFGVEFGKQLVSGLLLVLQGEDVVVVDLMICEILVQLKG